MVTELRHLAILDGWRALSISLVLIGHLLPVGPRSWGLNGALATAGMVMFFTLSGFLITRFLIEDGSIQRFILRRIFRIAPLAWAGIVLALIVGGGTVSQLIANVFFYANLPPFHLLPAAGHFWSLSVEVQFYTAIAVLVALAGQKGLLVLPLLALTVTSLRIANDQYTSIVTWFRADEILAGGVVALIHERWFGDRVRRWLSQPSIFVLLPLVIASSHPWFGPLNYARPYLSAILIGASIYNAPEWIRVASRSAVVIYIAKISYALYVFHGILAHTWLGSGDTLVKYAKRPLLFIAVFGFSHVSTFFYERRWVDLARRLTTHGSPSGLQTQRK